MWGKGGYNGPMPTPFTHLEIARRLLVDPEIPPGIRAQLSAHCPAFLLGCVVADARPTPQTPRHATHFYRYDTPITEHPWRVMLREYPALCQARDAGHRAFLAGYVAHLATDEAWSLCFIKPQFVDREWGNSLADRFLALHLVLIHMDERDERRLEPWQPETVLAARPQGWLPFMSDAVIADWRDFVGQQIVPGGRSKTLNIFGERIHRHPNELRRLLDSPEEMQRCLWGNISRAALSEAEVQLYDFTREQMCIYWEESG